MTETEGDLRSLICHLDEYHSAAALIGLTPVADRLKYANTILDDLIGKLHRIERLKIDLSAVTTDPDRRACYTMGFNEAKDQILGILNT